MEKKRGKDYKREEILPSAILGLIIAYIYWFTAIEGNPNSIVSINTLGNVKIYLMFLFIFSLATLIISYVLKNLHFSKSNTNVFINVVPLVVLVVVGGYIVYNNASFGGKLGYSLQALILMVTTLILIRVFSRDNDNLIATKYLMKLLPVIIMLVWYTNVSTSNTFVATNPNMGFGVWYNIHHSSAYIDSIYNVYNHIPFQGGITDQYGHYALFFYLPLKLLGGTTDTIAKCLGFIAAFSSALFTYSFHKVFKQDSIKLLFSIIMLGLGMYPACENIYWQTYPHRFLAPAIILGYTVYNLENRITYQKQIFWGTILMLLIFIWNTDLGLLSIITYKLVFSVMRLNALNIISVKRIVGVILESIIHIIIVVCISLLIVNTYNRACGGEAISILQYFALDNVGYIERLQNPLSFWDYEYSFKLIILLISFVYSFVHLLNAGEDETKKVLYLVLSSSSIGLGWMTYYINHSAGGSKMLDLFVLVCIFGMVELFGVGKLVQEYEFLKEPLIRNLKLIISVIMLMLASCQLQSYTNKLDLGSLKYFAGAYNYQIFADNVDILREYIDEDTLGLGTGTSAIFFELGMDKKSYGFDNADLDSKEYWNGNKVLMSQDYEPYIPENYSLVNQFDLGGMVFGLYDIK